jgi:hypothetical protein
MIEFINNDNDKIELYKYRILKNVIKDNIRINEEGKTETSVFLSDELVKTIKYTDTKFYKELQQGVDK